MEPENMAFSPFDAPKKEVKNPVTDNTGMKIETITDSELDGNKGGGNNPPPRMPGTPTDVPKDAPEFTIPNFDDVPGSTTPPFSGGGNSGGGTKPPGGEGTKMDDGFAKEFSQYTAKWLVDLFFRLLVFGIQSYAKIDRSEIVKAINDGLVEERFLKYVDEANKNVEREIKVTEEEKNFVVEPLKYFLEVKKVQVKPEYMFIGGALMISGQLFFRAMEVKKQNKEIIDKIMKESARSRPSQSSSNPNSDERTQSFSNSSTSRPSETFTVEKNQGDGDDVITYGPGDVEDMGVVD
jgi:hypothetical protein